MHNSQPNSRLDFGKMLNDMGLIGKGVEVGTLQGWFAFDLLCQWRGEKLYMIDSWRYMDNWKDDMNAHFSTQLNRMSDCMKSIYKFDRRACMIREMEDDAVSLFKDRSLDFVYLDADHSLDAVRAQIKRWVPKLVPGGIIGTHDYLDGKAPQNSAHYGVKTAIDEFCSDYGYEKIVTKETPPHEPSCFVIVQ